MGNITDVMPKEHPIITAIYAWHKQRGDAEPARGYLGASILGRKCERELWYTFRNCFKPDFSGRLYRLFETGDAEEPRMVAELRGIGCEVHEIDPATGQQFEINFAGGHGSGHMDGCALGVPTAEKTWHVLEFKTHNDKSFKKLEKEGVQKSKPEHYAQMQIYMGHTGMKRALYLAKNKNTDEIYPERVRFDSKYFKALMERAERIITAPIPPDRCSDRPDTFACRFCDAYKLCWGTSDVAVPLPCKSCRTCCHSTPEIDEGETWARWSCKVWERDLSLKDQYAGCDAHLLIPHLVSFASPVDSGDDWIEFENGDDGTRWRHGNGADGSWRTEELMKTPGPIVGHPAVNAVKDAFNGELDYIDNLTLIERYPPEDSEKLWDGPLDGKTSAAICKALGLYADTALPDPTGMFEDEGHTAVEYYGKKLVVVYHEHNHVAIWKGKE